MGALAFPGVLWARVPHGRLTKMVATVAVGTVLAAGASLIPGATTTPTSPSTVDVWVATNGNDSSCVRGDQSFPCLTVTKALTLAQNGDQVEVAAGTYSSAQTWNGGTNAVTISAASGATVNFSQWVQLTGSNKTIDGINFTFTPTANSNTPCVTTSNTRGASLTVSGASMTFVNGTVSANLAFDSTASGFHMQDSTVHALDLWDGPDNWTLDNVDQDVGGVSYCGTIGLLSGTIMHNVSNWEWTNSTFTHANNDADSCPPEPCQHSEALYIGSGSINGLLDGDTFLGTLPQGSTAHIFFTWFDDSAGVNEPSNICVTNSTFYPPINPYWFIDMRSELDWANNNIDIDPNTNTFVFEGGVPATIASISTAVRSC